MAIEDSIVSIELKSIETTTNSTQSFSSAMILAGEIPEDETKYSYSFSSVDIESFKALESKIGDTNVYKMAELMLKGSVENVVIAFGDKEGALDIEEGADGQEANVVTDVINYDKAFAEASTFEYYAILNSTEMSSEEAVKILDKCVSNKKIFIYSTTDKNGWFNDVDTKDRLAVYLYKNESNALIGARAVERAFANIPGSETWSYLNANGLVADSFDDAMELIKKNGEAEEDSTELRAFSICTNVAGRNLIIGGRTYKGEWIDVVRFKDWLIWRIQDALIGLLVRYPKIEYTDDGFELIEQTLVNVFEEGIANGGITERVSEDQDSYTIEMPSYNVIGDDFVARRNLEGITFTARLANAVHFITITGRIS